MENNLVSRGGLIINSTELGSNSDKLLVIDSTGEVKSIANEYLKNGDDASLGSASTMRFALRQSNDYSGYGIPNIYSTSNNLAIYSNQGSYNQFMYFGDANAMSDTIFGISSHYSGSWDYAMRVQMDREVHFGGELYSAGKKLFHEGNLTPDDYLKRDGSNNMEGQLEIFRNQAIGEHHLYLNTAHHVNDDRYFIQTRTGNVDSPFSVTMRGVTTAHSFIKSGGVNDNILLDGGETRTVDDLDKGVTAHGWGNFRDFGFGTSAVRLVQKEGYTSFNDFTYTSMTDVHSGDGLTDGPKTTSAGSLLNVMSHPNGMTQYFTERGTTNFYMRDGYGAWTPWVKMFHTGNHRSDSENDLRYLQSYTETDTLDSVLARGNTTSRLIIQNNIADSTWPYKFTTATAGNDNPSGFWVNSDGTPDMRLRALDGTVRVVLHANGSNSHVQTNGGNFGIGTNTPSEKLEVAGNIKVSATNGGVYFGTTTGTTSYIRRNGSSEGQIEIGSDNAIYFKETDANTTRGTFTTNDGIFDAVGGFKWNGQSLDSRYASASHSHSGYASSSHNHEELKGSNYISGGSEKPNWFGSGKLRYQMLHGSNLGAPDSWNDVLWISSYSGGDVKGSTAIISSKYSDWIGFSKQNYDATSWGTPREIWHSGNHRSNSQNDSRYLKRDGSNTMEKPIKFNTSDSETIIYSVNSTAGGPKQFYIEHDLGSVRIGNSRGNIYFDNAIRSSDFIGTSDERLKENIKIFDPQPIYSLYKSFNFIDDENKQKRVGVIAQELEVHHPEFVRTDEKGVKSVSYNDLHSAEIAYLKNKVDKQEEMIETQQSQIEELKAMVNQLLGK